MANGITVGSDKISDTVVVSEVRGQDAYEIIQSLDVRKETVS